MIPHDGAKETAGVTETATGLFSCRRAPGNDVFVANRAPLQDSSVNRTSTSLIFLQKRDLRHFEAVIFKLFHRGPRISLAALLGLPALCI